MIENQEILLVTPKDACRILGIGNTKLFDLLKTGKLRRVKLGRKSTRIPLEDIRSIAAAGV